MKTTELGLPVNAKSEDNDDGGNGAPQHSPSRGQVRAHAQSKHSEAHAARRSPTHSKHKSQSQSQSPQALSLHDNEYVTTSLVRLVFQKPQMTEQDVYFYADKDI
jgi:hypothetical protein